MSAQYLLVEDEPFTGTVYKVRTNPAISALTDQLIQEKKHFRVFPFAENADTMVELKVYYRYIYNGLSLDPLLQDPRFNDVIRSELGPYRSIWIRHDEYGDTYSTPPGCHRLIRMSGLSQPLKKFNGSKNKRKKISVIERKRQLLISELSIL